MSEIVILSHGGDPNDGSATRVYTSTADPLPVTVVSGGGGSGGDVNLIEVGGVAVALGQAAGAASVPVVVASDQSALGVVGNVAHDAVDSGNPVKLGAKAVTALPTAVSNLDRVDLVADTTGRLLVSQTVLADTTDGVAVGVNAAATGLSTYRNVSVTGAASAKASAGRLHGWHIANDSGADAYVHIYNTASGSVTVGTTTPALTLKVPAGGILDQPAGFPFAFSTAISVAAAAAATGATLAAAGVIVNLYYI